MCVCTACRGLPADAAERRMHLKLMESGKMQSLTEEVKQLRDKAGGSKLCVLMVELILGVLTSSNSLSL